MMDDLQQAYSAYQQALYHLSDPKEPKLWYGIGILYDRYGSLEHAEEAFSQVMRMEPTFEKANEIYFRLGIIYKQQQKFNQSLDCFKYIVTNPPRPLTEEDIWFQIGHVYEQQKEVCLTHLRKPSSLT
jgi:tetratricopeptide (TPR) repeat protein